MKKFVLCLLFITSAVRASKRPESTCARLEMALNKCFAGTCLFAIALVQERGNPFVAARTALENLDNINWTGLAKGRPTPQ